MESQFLLFTLFLVFSSMVASIHSQKQTQALGHLYKKKMKASSGINKSHFKPIHYINKTGKVHPQQGMKEKDRIEKLPGQPRVQFQQYGGYVTVDKSAGRALYYYFVEAQHYRKESLPLLLWLNGGPGCSSLAYGAMEELGPFRVHSTGKTLYKNRYSWNYAANVLFLESPAGIGNAVINDETDVKGMYYYFESHALISDETAYNIKKYCNFAPQDNTEDNTECDSAADDASNDIHYIDIYNIYAPSCHNSSLTVLPKKPSVTNFDPCSDYYIYDYLNRADVQEAMHANVTKLDHDWEPCSEIIEKWGDSPSTIIPLLQELMTNGLRVWVFSGDMDGRIPVTSTKYSIKMMKLPVKTKWHPWYLDEEVGGFTEVYEGDLTFATVRGAGHQVPSFQPKRALSLIKHFLDGTSLPDTLNYD